MSVTGPIRQDDYPPEYDAPEEPEQTIEDIELDIDAEPLECLVFKLRQIIIHGTTNEIIEVGKHLSAIREAVYMVAEKQMRGEL